MWRRCVIAAGVPVLLAAVMGGCGDDAAATVFIPGATPTVAAAAERQASTPLPTPTSIPSSA